MAGTLPQPGHMDMLQRPLYETNAPAVFSPASVYQMHNAAQYQPHLSPHIDPNMLRAHPQLLAQQYQSVPAQHPMALRQPGMMPQPGTQYSRPDMYAYGQGAPQYSPIDPRFGTQAFPMGGAMQSDMSHFSARSPEPIPSFPRGPPRKPKQSGHALWVGNLPPAATVTDLKDHFSRDAAKEIESLFLISKSNCAFVNYRSEAACVAAMNRFHDSRFHGVRLVCRLRRGSTTPATSSTIPDSATPDNVDLPDSLGTTADPVDDANPVIVGENRAAEKIAAEAGEESTTDASERAHKVHEKFYIVKSLTVQDLEASVRNGIWATQSHNEQILNKAFGISEHVYLIFSANKSGEYFGYARMASAISGEPVNLGSALETNDPKLAGTPQSIPTPATETAPKGRIIDDSARGTIFWEADVSDDEAESPTKEDGDADDGQQWGRQFKIEWMSTSRLPFFRTRGLRNPWNANREVKIARDGTELEPSVGRRLVQMFHRSPQPAHGGAITLPGGMLYR
ncbi:hypothetical protein LTR08_007520 [Meristemomyces frigidus]|nr:hypothetical protein LTR08_007520 [Meristemomyces frigidus]